MPTVYGYSGLNITYSGVAFQGYATEGAIITPASPHAHDAYAHAHAEGHASTSSKHGVFTHLEKEFVKKLVDDFCTAYADASMSALVDTGSQLKLGDIALALSVIEGRNSYFKPKTKDVTIYNRMEAKSFIMDNANVFSIVGNSLKDSEDHDEREAGKCLADLPFLLLEGYRAPVKLDITKSKDDLVMYKAKNGEVALRFATVEKRNRFLEQLDAPGIVDERFRTGTQYQHNPEGRNPVCYAENHYSIYFCSYQAGGGELAVNFGSEGNRNNVLRQLGFAEPATGVVSSSSHTGAFKDSQEGKTIFDTYGGSQSSAVYFSKEHNPFVNNGFVRFSKQDDGKYTVSRGQAQVKEISELKKCLAGEIARGAEGSDKWSNAAQQLSSMCSQRPKEDSDVKPSVTPSQFKATRFCRGD